MSQVQLDPLALRAQLDLQELQEPRAAQERRALRQLLLDLREPPGQPDLQDLLDQQVLQDLLDLLDLPDLQDRPDLLAQLDLQGRPALPLMSLGLLDLLALPAAQAQLDRQGRQMSLSLGLTKQLLIR